MGLTINVERGDFRINIAGFYLGFRKLQSQVARRYSIKVDSKFITNTGLHHRHNY